MKIQRFEQPQTSLFRDLDNGDAFVFTTSPDTLRAKIGTSEWATLPSFGTTKGIDDHDYFVIPKPQIKLSWYYDTMPMFASLEPGDTFLFDVKDLNLLMKIDGNSYIAFHADGTVKYYTNAVNTKVILQPQAKVVW